jgi:hypothetical protein
VEVQNPFFAAQSDIIGLAIVLKELVNISFYYLFQQVAHVYNIILLVIFCHLTDLQVIIYLWLGWILQKWNTGYIDKYTRFLYNRLEEVELEEVERLEDMERVYVGSKVLSRNFLSILLAITQDGV